MGILGIFDGAKLRSEGILGNRHFSVFSSLRG
jgi:hypothetical protein